MTKRTPRRSSTGRKIPALLDAERFIYDEYLLDPAANSLTCRYRLDSWAFVEKFRFPGGGNWAAPAVAEAARWVFLLVGVSYYKAGAPPIIDLGALAVTDTERAFLREFYIEGLGEYAFRSTPQLDLTALEIVGPTVAAREPAGFAARPGSALIPFGGGVDSIVSVELLRDAAPDAALFVVNRPGDRFEAIEQPAAVAGLPIVRAERTLDPQILRSTELGFRNGHVPVTGIISALAVMAAALTGRDAVVLSNEWSASRGNVEIDGRWVNHQYSKSVSFERGFRGVLAESIGPGLDYFSLLRPFTELWIAQAFSQLPQYFDTFRSCNRAFHINFAHRKDHWCAHCDKCAFVDLILAPFMDPEVLRGIFARGGGEPIDNPVMVPNLGTLLGLVPDAKPWECVGDVDECQVAAQMTIARADRDHSPILRGLVDLMEAPPLTEARITELLTPASEHFIPVRYLPAVLADITEGQ